MAEGFEENMRLLIGTLVNCYSEMQDAYQALPLPIALPPVAATDGFVPLYVAIIEGAERIDDLPVHPVAGKALFDASYHWISASTLILDYKITERESFFKTAVWNLSQANGLTELALALLRQG